MKTLNTIKRVIILSTLIIFFKGTFSQEVNVPFCENLMVIDESLGKRLSFFSSYPDFQQATVSQDDFGLSINIVFRLNGIFQTEQKTITEVELVQICNEVSEYQERRRLYLDDDYDQEARRRLIASSSTYSLGFYGWALPIAMGMEDGKSLVASYMFIGASGFFIPMFATKDKNITNGMAWGYTYGASLGIIHGATMAEIVDAEWRGYLGLAVLGSFAESFTAYGLAKQRDYSWGRMSTINSGGHWGWLYGRGAVLLFTEPNEINHPVWGLSALAFSAGGMVAGNFFYEKYRFTPGDIMTSNVYGIVGGYIPLVLMESLNVEEHRAYVAGAMLGSASGLAYGIKRSSTYNYSRQQGYLVTTGTTAGVLVGLGVGALAEASGTGYLWLTAIGATGGLTLTDYLVRESNPSNAQVANLNLKFNPFGLLEAMNKNNSPYKPWDPRYSSSIVNLNLMF